MRFTRYTDYTLRVMMYLAVKHASEEVATIDEMAEAYGISRSHLTKIVNELAQCGFIETTRGRSGGARLARLPNQISVGSLIRMAEKDFAVVECHGPTPEVNCVILPACNLRNALRRAVDAFLYELDKMTLEDAVIAPTVAASLLHIGDAAEHEATVPLSTLTGRPAKRKPRAAAKRRRAAHPRRA